MLKILAVVFQNVQQNIAVGLFAGFVEVDEIGGYHHKEAVGADSALEILAITAD